MFEEILEALGCPSFGDLLAALAYPSFDPNHVKAVLMAKEKDTKILEQDVIFLMHLHVLKGNNLSNIQMAIKRNDRIRFSRLINKYEIKANLGDSNRKNTVTLSRIALCFPYLACSVCMYLPPDIPRHVPLETLTTDYPRVMATQAFASFIPLPSQPNHQVFRAAHMLYLWKQNAIINPRKRADINEIEKYQLLGINTNVIESADKLRRLSQWKLVGSDGEVTLSVKKAAFTCNQLTGFDHGLSSSDLRMFGGNNDVSCEEEVIENLDPLPTRSSTPSPTSTRASSMEPKRKTSDQASSSHGEKQDMSV